MKRTFYQLLERHALPADDPQPQHQHYHPQHQTHQTHPQSQQPQGQQQQQEPNQHLQALRPQTAPSGTLGACAAGYGKGVAAADVVSSAQTYSVLAPLDGAGPKLALSVLRQVGGGI